MLHILMGRARTGKSERVLQRIAALGDASQQILLVPEHASHVAEMDLCRVCGDTASRHAEALTFKLLASRVLGICGDLFASVVKRQCGIKDYGTIFPGHGGILDRFDSVMFIAPFVTMVITAVFYV